MAVVKSLMTEAVIKRHSLDRAMVFWLQVEYGCEFIEARYNGRLAKVILQTREFWAWWVHQIWNNHDDILYNLVDQDRESGKWFDKKSLTNIEDVAGYYRRFHHPNKPRIKDLYLNDAVFEIAYQRFIKEIEEGMERCSEPARKAHLTEVEYG